MKRILNRIISAALAVISVAGNYSGVQAARGDAYEGAAATKQIANQTAMFYKRLEPGATQGWTLETSGAMEQVIPTAEGWICEAGGYIASTHYARYKYKTPEESGIVLTTFYMKSVVILPPDFYIQQTAGFRLMNTTNHKTTLNGNIVGANNANESRTSVYINSNHSLRVIVEHERTSKKTLYISSAPLPEGQHTIELFGSLNAVAPWYLRVDGTVVAAGMEMLSMNSTSNNERVATRFVVGIDGAADQDVNTMNLQVKSFEIANYDVPGITSPSDEGSEIYDNTDDAFTYSPAWNTVLTQMAYGGSHLEATQNGASITLPFTGESFGLLYKTGRAFSKLDVYVDDVLVATLNQGTSRIIHQKRWDYPGQLTYGNHTLKLVLRVTNSTLRRGSLDAVIIR